MPMREVGGTAPWNWQRMRTVEVYGIKKQMRPRRVGFAVGALLVSTVYISRCPTNSKVLVDWRRTESLCQITLPRRGRLKEQSFILLVTHCHRDLSAQRCTLDIRVCRSETGHALVVVHAIARLIVFRLFRHCERKSF